MNPLLHPAYLKLINNFPLHLNSSNPKHILVFRRVLEWSHTHGLWHGFMAETS